MMWRLISGSSLMRARRFQLDRPIVATSVVARIVAERGLGQIQDHGEVEQAVEKTPSPTVTRPQRLRAGPQEGQPG